MYKSAVGLNRGIHPPQSELFMSMKIPRAFIYGEYSLPDPNMDKLSSGGIKILIVPKSGHGMMHDNPDGFALALLQSFQS
jgi:pimeloyl-ACP methyl ester carboxylesterase